MSHATHRRRPLHALNGDRDAAANASNSTSMHPKRGCWTRVWAGFCVQGSLWENFVSIDLFGIWRRHVVWAKHDGDELRTILAARFATTTVFQSLVVSAELAVFFGPATVNERVRNALDNNEMDSLEYWAGMFLCIAIFFSLSALISNFTAWSIFIVVSKENSATVLRSSMGLYAVQMPSRLVVLSTYLLYLWIALFWWIILPKGAAITLTVAGILQICHIASTYSTMGRIIMATGAMSSEPILEKSEEEKLTPRELYEVLLDKTYEARANNIPVNLQYRQGPKTQLNLGSTGEEGTEQHRRAEDQEYARDVNSLERGERDPAKS